MHTSADVVVVGGGLVGTSVAYELACEGLSVTLVDASHLGRASDAGAGIVSPETFHDRDEEWFAFALDAAAHLLALVPRLAEDGVDAGPEVFARCGSLAVALAEHEDPWFTEVLDLARARSPDVTEIAPAEARELFPPLGELWRAMYSPAAARLDGRSLCRAVGLAAKRRGATHLDSEAMGIDERDGRVTAVRLADGVVGCGALVLAGGAWSAGAASWLGVGLPVTPTKGQIVHVALEGNGASDAVATTSGLWPIVQPILNFYLVPWPGGRVACGGTFEAEAGFDTRPTAGGVRDLLRECVKIAPGLSAATFLEVRVGLRPTSADDRPFLGRLSRLSNVHVCTGHGANGLHLGPYSAALVAAGIVGEPPAELARYAADRLSGGYRGGTAATSS
ncbi:MAG: NAD(P)/FAD-dependent oxidoreductase [Acidimicrobiales bacterium]